MECSQPSPRRGYTAADKFWRVITIIGVLVCATWVSGECRADEPAVNKPSGQSALVLKGKGLTLHKEMYILPVSVANEYHNEQCEVVFQISAKQRLFNSNFYFGYTQKSFWQAYDFDNSSPFRETNYNPELFYRIQSGTILPDLYGMDIGFEHESNGQKEPISRSWNRIYAAPYYRKDSLLLYAKFWYRIPEKDKAFPEDPEGDENPDITDYLGYSEIRLLYQFGQDHLIHTMVHGNIRTGKGGLGINYSIPFPDGNTFLVFRLFHGYGESLIDYNTSITRFGAGIMFKR